MESFYSVKSQDTEIIKTFSQTKIFILFAILTVFFFGVSFFPISDQWDLGIKSFIALLGLVITVGFRLFDDLKVSITRPQLFAPEQFEECFNQMMEYSMKKKSLVDEIKYHFNWILKGHNYEKNIDRLIIVIDNIDRCHKEQAYELLTNLKNFLTNKFSITFLVPVDDRALKDHLFNISKQDLDRLGNEKEEFLRKFFNTTIRIKPHLDAELVNFVERLNSKLDLKLKPDTINLLGSDYATNPRRIIQLINNLSAEQANYDDDFAQKHETEICIFLIIREEWEDYYNRLVVDVSQFQNPNSQEIKELINSNLSLFLNRINPITRKLTDDVISKIITNSSAVFDGISHELKQAIDNGEIEKVINLLDQSKDQSKKRTISYIIKRFGDGIKGNYKTTIENLFSIICAISEKLKLDISDNNRIIPLMGENLEKLIGIENNFDRVVNYSMVLTQQNENGLEKAINDSIGKILSFDKDGWDESSERLFHSAIKNYENAKVNTELFQKSFLKLYQNGLVNVTEDLLDDKINDLVKKEFMEHLVDEMNLNEPNKFRDDFDFLLQKIEMESSTVEKVFLKINSEHPDFELKDSEVIKLQIEFINTILNRCKQGILKDNHTNLKKWFDAINTNRKKLKPELKNHQNAANWLARSNQFPQQFIQVNLLTDTELGDKKNIIQLGYNIYRTTLAKIEVSHIFKALIVDSEHKGEVLDTIEKLKNSGFVLHQFFDIILDNSDYSQKSLNLLKYILLLKDNKSEYYFKATDRLKQKIQEMFKSIFESSSIMDFFVETSKDSRIAEILKEIVIKDSQENILKLHEDLWSVVSEDLDIFEYKDNLGFMKAIAKRGSKSKIREVVRVIVHKLNTEQDFESAKEITLQLSSLNQSDSKSLVANFESFEDENLSDEVKEIVSFIKSIV